VVYFGPRATYFCGGSRTLNRQVMAPYLMHFEIMRYAKARGHECYDLWGLRHLTSRGIRNFSAFKTKFGGEEVHLAPTLGVVLDAAAYDQYGAIENSF
jgi:peptidoglycan pentaglycine glycine transferase (the first glycine)